MYFTVLVHWMKMACGEIYTVVCIANIYVLKYITERSDFVYKKDGI